MAPLFGELSIKGESLVADVAGLYDLEIPAEDRDKSVAEFFEAHIRGRPQPGHRLPLGRATLVARHVDDHQVVRAGLQLEELLDTLVTSALAQPALRPTSRPCSAGSRACAARGRRCPREDAATCLNPSQLPARAYMWFDASLSGGMDQDGKDQADADHPSRRIRPPAARRPWRSRRDRGRPQGAGRRDQRRQQLAENWRRVRAAIHELRPPHAS
jgi:hypothetical protein